MLIFVNSKIYFKKTLTTSSPLITAIDLKFADFQHQEYSLLPFEGPNFCHQPASGIPLAIIPQEGGCFYGCLQRNNLRLIISNSDMFAALSYHLISCRNNILPVGHPYGPSLRNVINGVSKKTGVADSSFFKKRYFRTTFS